MCAASSSSAAAATLALLLLVVVSLPFAMSSVGVDEAASRLEKSAAEQCRRAQQHGGVHDEIQ